MLKNFDEITQLAELAPIINSFKSEVQWSDHSNATVFKRDVIHQLHRQLFVEYDKEAEIIYISPLGTRRVEDQILARNGGVR